MLMKNIPFLMKFPSDYTLLSLTRTKGTRSCISYFETLEICGCFFGGEGLRYWKVLNWDSETGSGILGCPKIHTKYKHICEKKGHRFQQNFKRFHDSQ